MNQMSTCHRNLFSFGNQLSLVLIVSALCTSQVWADDQSDSVASSQTIKETNQASSTTLQGSIETVQLNLEVLRDIGLDIKKLRSAAEELYNEVTLQPVSLQMQPNVVGMGTVIYTPVAAAPIYMAPRKKRIDLAMNDIRPIVTLMKEDVDKVLSGQRKIDLPENTDEVLDPLFTNWESLVKDIYKQFTDLEPLTQTSSYDNRAIARSANSICKDAKSLENIRKKVFKIIQKEGQKAQK